MYRNPLNTPCHTESIVNFSGHECAYHHFVQYLRLSIPEVKWKLQPSKQPNTGVENFEISHRPSEMEICAGTVFQSDAKPTTWALH